MQRVFTKDDRFEVNAMRALLESHGIDTLLKNEFTSSIMGEVPFFDTWPEIWVAEEDVLAAKRHITDAQNQIAMEKPDWHCEKCEEENPGTFELCWNCGANISS
ncbi:MAG: DUF2007 domain-containing protein [Acidiferrobacterales bacterium]|nr:DUF2007 domain-containing protein [Acidiferrobacterales bacterium]